MSQLITSFTEDSGPSNIGSAINILFVHHFSNATPGECILEAIMLKQPVVDYSEVRDLFVLFLLVYHSCPDQIIEGLLMI